MAATAVYADVVKVPLGGSVGEGKRCSNSDIIDTAFELHGGTYGVTCKASTYGTVTLQILGADGATWLTALTAFAADGAASVTLPPGSYRLHAA